MDKSTGKVFCISYDLLQPGRDYSTLINTIKEYSIWWHQTKSVWMIKTDNNISAKEIRDKLSTYIDSNDKLFVICVSEEWAARGFTKDEYDWLHKNLS